MNLSLLAVPWRTIVPSAEYGLDDPGSFGDRMTDLANAIAGMGAGWTKVQDGYYNQSVSYAVLSHTSGAQLMLIAGFYNNGEYIHADNCWDGQAVNYYTFRVAFGSSGLSSTIPTISNAMNPYDVSTFCVDYGLHKFIRFEHNSANLSFAADGQHYWVLDEDSPYIALATVTGDYNSMRDFAQWIDEACSPWTDLEDKTDAGGPLVIFYTNQNEGPLTTQIYAEVHQDGASYTYSGNYDALSRRPYSTNSWTRQMVLGEWPADYHAKLAGGWTEPVAQLELYHSIYGRKGLLAYKYSCHARQDLGIMNPFTLPGETGFKLVQVRRGDATLIPWPVDEPFIQ